MRPTLFGFYVYTDHRQDGSMFYVGKGTGGRFFRSYRQNIHWMRIVRKERGYTRRLVAQNLNEAVAFNLERQLIIKNKQTIVNVTEGGGGASGVKWTDEQRSNHAKRMVGNKYRVGVKIPDYQKRIVSMHSKRKKSNTTKMRMSKAAFKVWAKRKNKL